MASNTDTTYPVRVLNGYPYRITANGYRRITWHEYRRQLAQQEQAAPVLRFGELPDDFAAWVELDHGTGAKSKVN